MQQTKQIHNDPPQVGRDVLLLATIPVPQNVHNKNKGTDEDTYMDDSIKNDDRDRMLDGYIQASTTDKPIVFRAKPEEDTETEENR